MKPQRLKPPALCHHKESGRAYFMARDELGAHRMLSRSTPPDSIVRELVPFF